MGEEGLHRAAQERRDRERAEARAASRAAIREADRSRTGPAHMKRVRVQEAVAEAGWRGKLITTIALCVGLFGPMAIAIFVFVFDSIVPLLLVSLACLIGSIVLARLAEKLLASVRLRRVYRVGRGFDPAAYLDALGDNRHRATLVARIAFAARWSDAARASAPDAVRAWMSTVTSVTWDGEALVLRRESIECTEWIPGGEHDVGGTYFNNRKLHACFLEVIDRVVPRLEEVAPITALEISIEGPIEDWDADA